MTGALGLERTAARPRTPNSALKGCIYLLAKAWYRPVAKRHITNDCRCAKSSKSPNLGLSDGAVAVNRSLNVERIGGSSRAVRSPESNSKWKLPLLD